MKEDCGVVTFFSSQHAIHAETVLKKANFVVELIPGPKEISPNCGVALRYDYQKTVVLQECLTTAGVPYEACHLYAIRQHRSLMDQLLGR